MREHVLIVDDENANLYMIETLLKGHGFQVTSAENGKDALEKARLVPPDLIVTDILMPVMDGYALCREWKSDNTLKEIPFVFYTATYTDPKDEVFALGLGADRFILKPQEPEVLISILHEVLQQTGTEKERNTKPLGEEMEFFRRHNEILFKKLEKKMADLETVNRQLRESEEWYRMIAEKITDIVWLADMDLRTTYVTPSVQGVLGFTPEEWIHQAADQQFTPESLAYGMEALTREFALEEEGNAEPDRVAHLVLEYYHKDGSTRWMDTDITGIRDDRGTLTGLYGVSRDVTARKQAEDELKGTKALYQLLFEDAPHGVVILDPETARIVGFNEKACLQLGYSREEFAELNVSDIEEIESLDEIKATIAQVIHKGRADFETRHRTKQGEVRDVKVTAQYAEIQGKHVYHCVWQDITELKKAEEALRDSEQRYRLIVENVNDIVWIVGLDLQFVYVSPSNTRVSGYTREEIMKMALSDVVIPESFELASQILSKELALEASGQSFDPNRSKTLELEVYHKDGRQVWLEVSAAFNRDDEGRPMEILAVGRDITDRKRAEGQLRESEKKYRTILEEMEEGYWEVDLAGRYISCNDALCKIHGFPPEKLMKMTFRDYTDPETAERIATVCNQVYRTGKPSRISDHEIIRGDGTTGRVEFNVSLMREDEGSPIGFRGITRDVTKRIQAEQNLRESEEKYRTILESIEDGYWEVDLKGRYTFCNDALCALMARSREEIIGMNNRSYVDPDVAEKVYRIFNAVYRTGIPASVMDYRFERVDGRMVTHELSVHLRRDAAGAPIGFRGISRDVTERRTMEEALAESERRYRMIVENMHDSITLLDLDLNYVYQSPSGTRSVGYAPQEIRNMPVQDQMTPESYRLLEQVLVEEFALESSGKPVDPHRSRTMELEIYHKDGGTVWEETTASFQRDEQGRPVGILLTSRDITDRKRAEERLRESEEKYRTILDSIEEGYWEVDLKGSYTFCNDALCTLTGFSREELLAKDRFRYTDPETAKKTYKIFNEIYRTGIPANVHEYQFTRKDGSRAIHELFVSLRRNAEGSPIGFRGVSRDVTERRTMEKALAESEQRYRMIVENIHDVIMVVGVDLTEKYRSPSAAWLTGYSLEELAGVPLQEQVPPESYALAQQVLGEELEKEFGPEPADPHRSRVLEMEVYHKNGGTIWVEETATFLRDDEGKPEAILLAVRDITERKRLEEEKGKLEGQLIQAQKMETVGRLAGGVAHDFNNMLSVILGYADLAKLSLVKEHPVLKDIVEIEKAAIRSRDITSQLLAFSRKQIIAPTVLNLNDLVINTEKSLIRLIGEDIDLRVHLEEEPWMIKFDPSQIEQIMINLAVNARDAMPGGGTLTIETKNVVADESYCRGHVGFTPGDYVQLSVSDNGTGMDRETMDHIFEPFFTTKEVGKGTGLGMATVYGIIKQNNGYITLYSEQGHGTTFTIYLPRTTQGKEVREEDEKEALLNGVGNILLVEDDPMVLEITKGMLEIIGYGVIIAETPLDAVKLYQDHDTPVSLVITDVVMPSMSGKELIDRLREIRPDTRALFMSGYTEDAIAHHGVLEQGVHFLQKPFRLGELARKVREAMVID